MFQFLIFRLSDADTSTQMTEHEGPMSTVPWEGACFAIDWHLPLCVGVALLPLRIREWRRLYQLVWAWGFRVFPAGE